MASHITDIREDNLWVLVWKDPEISEEDGHCWIAHALNYDVVSQGRTVSHAVAQAREAAEIFMLDRLNAGRDPLEYKAPQEDWDRLAHIHQQGRRVAIGELSDEERDKLTFAVEVKVSAIQLDNRERRVEQPEEPMEKTAATPWAHPTGIAA